MSSNRLLIHDILAGIAYRAADASNRPSTVRPPSQTFGQNWVKNISSNLVPRKGAGSKILPFGWIIFKRGNSNGKIPNIWTLDVDSDDQTIIMSRIIMSSFLISGNRIPEYHDDWRDHMKRLVIGQPYSWIRNSNYLPRRTDVFTCLAVVLRWRM